MCRMAAADGVRQIVATPHANDEYSYDRKRHGEALAKLQVEVGNGLTLGLGCDFHFSLENVQAALEDPRRFTIGESGYLLIEFSDFAVSPYITNAIAQLRRAGVRPIVTHPERNLMMQRSRDSILRFV